MQRDPQITGLCRKCNAKVLIEAGVIAYHYETLYPDLCAGAGKPPQAPAKQKRSKKK